MRHKAPGSSSTQPRQPQQTSALPGLPLKDSFIARQPILDRKLRIFGYEILYRETPNDQESRIVDGDSASLSVIRNILLLTGTDSFTGGVKAFVNFTQNLLLQEAPYYLPREWAVVEVVSSLLCKFYCVMLCSTGRLLATFPIGLDLQCNSIFSEMKASRV